MSEPDASRRRLLLQSVAGVGLILLGATALLWLVFADRLPSNEVSSANLTLWAIVRPSAAIALAAGTWLVAMAQVNRRHQRRREESTRSGADRS